MLLSTILLLAVAPIEAAVRLPKIIGDHMVLQRDMKVPVWGWADPGEKVTVAVGASRVSATDTATPCEGSRKSFRSSCKSPPTALKSTL